MKKRLASLLLSAALLLLAVPAGAVGQVGSYQIRELYPDGFIDTNNVFWSFGGLDEDGNTSQNVKLIDNVQQYDSSGGTYAVLRTDGTLWVWTNITEGFTGGQYGHGVLGDGTTGGSEKPVHAMDDVVAFDIATNMVAAVTSDGSLWMWGGESMYLLGGASNAVDLWDKPCQTTPLKIMDGVADVAVEGHYAMALKADGTLWEWGDWWHSEPAQVLDQVKWADVTENGIRAAIRADGSLWMWGVNERGQLGNGRQGDEILGGELYQSTPVKIMDQVGQVSLDLYCAAAVQADGSLWVWGESALGQLGNGERYNYSHTEPPSIAVLNLQTIPDKIMDNIAFVELDSGVGRAIDRSGALWMWGENWRGALGNGYQYDYKSRTFGAFRCPRIMPDKVLDHVVQVSGNGEYRTVAVTEDGSLWMWGEIGYGISNATRENFAISINGSDVSDDHQWSKPIQTVPYRMEKEGRTSLFFVSDLYTGRQVESFRDVGPSTYFYEPVYWCLVRGITAGTGENTFGPHDTCTTAQIITFLWRAYGSPTPAGGSSFSDVPVGAWYADAAAWAEEEGLVAGALFHGNAPAARAATMTYLWKLADRPEVGSTLFSDVPAGADYAQAVSWAVSEGITAGTGEDTFGPNEICTRAQIVTFLYNALAD